MSKRHAPGAPLVISKSRIEGIPVRMLSGGREEEKKKTTKIRQIVPSVPLHATSNLCAFLLCKVVCCLKTMSQDTHTGYHLKSGDLLHGGSSSFAVCPDTGTHTPVAQPASRMILHLMLMPRSLVGST